MTKRILRKLRIDEISAVDKPAQDGATARIMKSDVGPVIVLTSADEGHAHAVWIRLGDKGGETSFGRNPADDQGHAHPWNFDDDGNISIGLNAGHRHTVDGDELAAAFMAIGEARLRAAVGDTLAEMFKRRASKLSSELPQLRSMTREEKEVGRLEARRDKLLDELGRIDVQDDCEEKITELKAEIDQLETEIDLRKDDPMNDFSKAMTALDEVLEGIAKNAQRDGETMEQAYDRLLSTDPNFQTLVQGRNDVQDVMVSAHRHPAGEAATKAHADVQKADQQLDALAATYAAKNGVTFEQAYDTIIQQPEGAQLYKKYVEAQNRLI